MSGVWFTAFPDRPAERQVLIEVRAALAATFALPPGAPDFDCPHGVSWDGAAAPVPDLAAVRLAACRMCDAYNGAVCEERFHCGACLSTWLRWVGAPESGCPRGRWAAEHTGTSELPENP